MKKPTSKSKQWNRIHIYNIQCRENRRTTRRKNSKRNEKRRPVSIKCPQVFSLRKNFNGVTKLLKQIRDQSKRQRNENVYIDFREITELSPAAALTLAAELDRWNNRPLRQGRLKSIDVDKWNDQVRSLLDDMGFFDLLQVKNPPSSDQNRNEKYIKFRTGRDVDGKAIDLLQIDDLEPMVGKMPRKLYLYGAVTEAMTNVVHHAKPSKWWLSASYNKETNEVMILIYDHGEGIPKTLPRKFSEELIGILSNDHARMIEVAHELPRSKSGKKHRGHGLQTDVRGYLEKLDCYGCYRVVSLRGEYIFERGPSGESYRRISHTIPLSGTLIEWRLNLEK